MTNSGLLVAAALALTVTAAPAAENEHSANYMLPYCRNFIDHKWLVDPLKQGLCAGIVEGIALTGSAVLVLLPSNSNNDKVDPYLSTFRQVLCIDTPDQATAEQSVRIVVAYIDARPARMHEDFRNLAREALRTAWPCK